MQFDYQFTGRNMLVFHVGPMRPIMGLYYEGIIGAKGLSTYNSGICSCVQ